MSVLRVWTVYDHPKDYPDRYVARLFEVDGNGPHATGIITTSETLEDLQDELEALGLVRLMRLPEDDPVILETWL